MNIFIDTSALCALLDRDESQHERVKTAWGRIVVPGNTLVTTNYIVTETIALLQRRFGLDSVRTLDQDILPLVNIEWIDETAHRAGLAAVFQTDRRALSFVDCVSFEVMRSEGIQHAFTIDSHFKKQGFKVIP